MARRRTGWGAQGGDVYYLRNDVDDTGQCRYQIDANQPIHTSPRQSVDVRPAEVSKHSFAVKDNRVCCRRCRLPCGILPERARYSVKLRDLGIDVAVSSWHRLVR